MKLHLSSIEIRTRLLELFNQLDNYEKKKMVEELEELVEKLK